MSDPNAQSDDNPMMEYLQDMYGEQLASYILKTRIDQERCKQEIDQLDTDLKGLLGRVQVGVECISPDEIEYYLQQKECKHLYKLVKSDFEDEFSMEAANIYRKNCEPVVEHADELIEKRRKELYQDSYGEIIKIEQSNRDDADKILERIKNPYHSPETEALQDQLQVLQRRRNVLRTGLYGPPQTQIDVPPIGGDNDFIYKLFAVWMHKPELPATLFQFEDEFREFPLQWLTHLSTPVMRNLYTTYKNGEIKEQVIIQEVESEGYFDALREKAERLPVLKNRSEILSEIIDNYKSGRYASMINLILPQIEFLMWIYAAYIDQHSPAAIFSNLDCEDFWKFNTERCSEAAILTTNGNEADHLRVRTLVKDTAFSDYLNPAVMEYFDEKLYAERNPILHGSISDYNTKLNAAKKLVFFRKTIDMLYTLIVHAETGRMEPRA